MYFQKQSALLAQRTRASALQRLPSPSPARTWVLLQLLDLAGHAAAVCDGVDNGTLQPRRLLKLQALLLRCHGPHNVGLEADDDAVAAKLLQRAVGQLQAAGW